jgi:predicted AAA+ superfamily ATPase
MIDRPDYIASVRQLFRSHPCVAILGPRQCGKTTLARMLSTGEPSSSIFDLESPLDARKLAAPLRTLGALDGLVILDEVQRKPDLFEVLRVLVDRPLAIFGARNAYFWATHGGAELDLMVTVRGRRYGFEFKVADAPGATRSMRIALSDLGLEHLWTLYPGTDAYALDERLSVLPLRDIAGLRERLIAGPYRQ